jgi:hypothetical protein
VIGSMLKGGEEVKWIKLFVSLDRESLTQPLDAPKEFQYA